MDLISRQAAIDAIDECYCGGEDSCGEPWIYKENAVEAINMIEPSPSAEPKRGKWVDMGKDPATGKWDTRLHIYCSECGHRSDDKPTKYCPNCGAKMEAADGND